ncbi:MAG: M15 family metallopeptidase [Xanthobacteraceae bacterium]|jgi:D-alanyl-D-alanine carboxypeptidase
MAARTCAIALGVIGLCAAPALADPALDALIAAYPDRLAGYDQKDVIWKDGTRMTISDGRTGKSFDELIGSPDIKDQFAIPYPLGTEIKVPAVNEDPGRIRNEPFFLKMYGDCRKGEVSGRLKPVAWMPGRRGGTVSVTTVNGINQRLAEVVKELETLPGSMTQYLVPSAGTYNCRPIANTNRLSVHAFGAAIDVNSKFADYWEWSKGKDGKIIWKNRVPAAIGDIFERHGFIWGAKWYHFDSMHFEYRPEVIALARQGWPRR